MGYFNRDDGDGFGRDRGNRGRRGGFGGGRGGRGGGRGGFGRDRDSRRPMEMHEVTCDKCGKRCEVPFKPTGDKPVYCSECFGNEGGSRRSFGSNSGGMTSEQFEQINIKLDKILGILDMIEFEDEEGEEDEEEEEDEKE